MKENKSRREFLSHSGKMVTAAALFGATAPMADSATSGAAVCETKGTMNITDSHYYLDNVLLEAGFEYEGAVVAEVSEEERLQPNFVERLSSMISDPLGRNRAAEAKEGPSA